MKVRMRKDINKIPWLSFSDDQGYTNLKLKTKKLMKKLLTLLINSQSMNERHPHGLNSQNLNIV